MLANTSKGNKKSVHDVLRKVTFFADLDDHLMNKISDALVSATYPDGVKIIIKGEVGEFFYIIKEGTAKVHDIGTSDMTIPIGSGDFFGERALMTGDPRAASITATSECSCLLLSRDTFEKTLGPLQGLIDQASRKRGLLGVPIIKDSKFQPHEITRLADYMIEQEFAPGTLLTQIGMPYRNQCLFIIRTGTVSVETEGGGSSELKDSDFFGDKSLLLDDNALSTQTTTVTMTTICDVLSKQDIARVLGNINRLGAPPEPTGPTLNSTVRLKDLKKLRILGVGTFGKVWLVTQKKSDTPLALKMINKYEIINQQQVEGVIREKSIMSELDHPFVINLVAAFQDDKSLYMLVGLVQGGELFSVVHTDTSDGIPNNNARFYAACILESLSHLHHRSVCYRDLKPENVLICSKGYCVLVDLGFAKIVTDKTYTLCGTPEYLAPEIILSKGHDKGVDYWALGIMIYEMLAGRTPFFDQSSNQVTLFKKIVQARYSFPHGGVVNSTAQDLVQKLVVRRQANRLGCLSRGDADIRDHEWFSSIDVHKLLKKEIRAPWVPRIKDPLDSSHFASYRELEQEASPNHPALTAAQQAQFKGF
jgi:protein kinase A